MNKMELTNKVVIITGAAQGIGLAIAKRLAMARALLAMVDVNFGRVQDEAKKIIGTGLSAVAFGCDVSKADSVHTMINGVLDQFGHIDILINNAGIVGRTAPIQEVTDDDWNRMIGIDLTGVFYCCREVIPHMLKRGSGRIINVASISGKEGNPNMVPYSSAKAGVIGLTKALAKEVARNNVLVNAVAPALIKTDLLDDLSPEQVRYMTERIPMGRLGQPEEVAAMVHWLSSDEASFSTGAVFDLSGGRATY
jgi:3-oxoacyl-[acyl-carrier protein] reductase